MQKPLSRFCSPYHRAPTDAASSSLSPCFDPQSMPCMTSERVALCAGCGRKIADRYYLLAVDKQWHMRCLKCCECKLNLESELTCFSKDGSIYCKEDYYRYGRRAGEKSADRQRKKSVYNICDVLR